MLFRCQPGFESWLAEEVLPTPATLAERGEGWLRLDDSPWSDNDLAQFCFVQETLLDEREISGDSVNGLAEKILAFFFESSREERFETQWPFLVETASGQDGLGRRADAVKRAVEEMLKKRMSRVAKLAGAEKTQVIGEVRGLFVYFVDFGRAFVSRCCVFGGQRRMADDALAPSRSYLKIEEAYGLLGQAPVADQTVADLGAAPGGWSYSAAKRGAQVVAIDNGPLKGGALDHPNIEHRREDAFHFSPQPGEVFDWMFCDLLEDPHHVLQNLIGPWLERRWCRRFIVILKFGRVDALALVRELRRPESVLSRCAHAVRIRHLFHNREELTIVGEVTT